MHDFAATWYLIRCNFFSFHPCIYLHICNIYFWKVKENAWGVKMTKSEAPFSCARLFHPIMMTWCVVAIETWSIVDQTANEWESQGYTGLQVLTWAKQHLFTCFHTKLVRFARRDRLLHWGSCYNHVKLSLYLPILNRSTGLFTFPVLTKSLCLSIRWPDKVDFKVRKIPTDP